MVVLDDARRTPPYTAYAAIMATFAGGLAGLFGRGPREAIGELVTRSRCVGTWVAAGVATTQVLTPRVGRLLTWTLAAAGRTTSSRPASPRSRTRATSSSSA